MTYSIYLGTTPTFPLNSQSLIVSGLPSSTNQYTITGLDPTATYYPVVVAVLPDGTSSDPSAGAANGGNPTTIGTDPGSTPTSNPDPSSPGVTSSGDVPPNDDSYSPQVDLGFQINFYGRKYTQVFVNNNGNLTFDYALSQYTPQDITQLGYPMIAPFWGDVDTRTDVNPNTGDSGCGTVTYHPTTVGGRRAFEADWTGTGYYNLHSNLKNTFSVQIVNRDDINIGDFDIVFNHYQLQWETGDASGGTNGMGGTPAYAGWTNGSLLQGDSYQLTGSGVSGGLIGMTGRKVYQIRNVDLALDSDNNEDTKPPEHNAAEEQLQDQTGKPGKVVTVNDGDTNRRLVESEP